MRARRGNYMIMFAMLLPLMLGFMALAIDIGRIRVTRVQAQGAADAASLAALATLRDGGSKSEAEAVAEAAANATRLQRLGEEAVTSEFEVDLDYGDWDFATQSWSVRSSSINSVTVNIAQTRPLGLMFAPIFNVAASSGGGLARKVFAGGPYDGSQDRDRVGKTVRIGRRGAMRPRDIVIAVDVSQNNRENLDDIKDGLAELVNGLRDYDIDADRVALMLFAGEAVVVRPLEKLRDGHAGLMDEIDNIAPCSVDEDAWYHWYRFYSGDIADGDGYDPELETEHDFVYNYNVVVPGPPDAFDAPTLAWTEDGAAFNDFDDFMGAGAQETFPGGLTENMTLDEPQQCLLWTASLIFFQFTDPRRIDEDADLIEFAPLTCHAGNYWEGRFDRWDEDVTIPEVDCTEVLPEELFEGQLAFVDSDGEPDIEMWDRSYSQAGVSPGAALEAALDLFDDAGPSRSEPTVLLVTSSMPRCGAAIDPVDAWDCDDLIEARLTDALDLADQRNVNVHVVGIYEPGSEDDDYMSEMTAGRGFYGAVEDARDLPDMFNIVASDIRLQMVQ